MDTTRVAHIVSDVLVMSAITAYFAKRSSTLETRVLELEKQTSALIKNVNYLGSVHRRHQEERVVHHGIDDNFPTTPTTTPNHTRTSTPTTTPNHSRTSTPTTTRNDDLDRELSVILSDDNNDNNDNNDNDNNDDDNNDDVDATTIEVVPDSTIEVEIQMSPYTSQSSTPVPSDKEGEDFLKKTSVSRRTRSNKN